MKVIVRAAKGIEQLLGFAQVLEYLHAQTFIVLAPRLRNQSCTPCTLIVRAASSTRHGQAQLQSPPKYPFTCPAHELLQ
jgi:hypothetical protein